MNDLDLCRTIGNEIKERRTALHLTQHELANLVGTSRESISAMECGRRNNLSLYKSINDALTRKEVK